MKTVGFFEDYKGMAVLLRGEGVSPLCMVEASKYAGCWKPVKGRSLRDAMCFATKKDAVEMVKNLRFPLDSVVRYEGKLSGRVWAIRYDIRYNYLLSPNWDDEMVRNVVLSCKKLRHKWTDGWICDYCGKRKADLEEFKHEPPKWSGCYV